MWTGVENSTILWISTEDMEYVQKFSYLGSVESETEGTEKNTFAQLRPVWQLRLLTRRVKLKIFRSNVKAVLVYRCERWKLTKDIHSYWFQVCISCCLHLILGINWTARIFNEYLMERCRVTKTDQQIKHRKWNWIGHALRREGKLKRSFPKTTYWRTVADEPKKVRKTLSDVKFKNKYTFDYRLKCIYIATHLSLDVWQSV